MNRERIQHNLEAVRARMAEAARRAGRQPGEVTLVAVTKRQPPEAARVLCDLGAIDLGENYPQELWAKVAALPDRGVRWHLIGHLQSNKAKKTLPMVHTIHGVDSLKLLRTLAELSPELNPSAQALIQVNTSGEASKHGWEPEGLLADAEAIAACRGVSIVGLMTMAALGTSAEEARPSFARLRTLRENLRERTGLPLPELSMGMTADFPGAIEEGATLIRVGTALFEGLDA